MAGLGVCVGFVVVVLVSVRRRYTDIQRPGVNLECRF